MYNNLMRKYNIELIFFMQKYFTGMQTSLHNLRNILIIDWMARKYTYYEPRFKRTFLS